MAQQLTEQDKRYFARVEEHYKIMLVPSGEEGDKAKLNFVQSLLEQFRSIRDNGKSSADIRAAFFLNVYEKTVDQKGYVGLESVKVTFPTIIPKADREAAAKNLTATLGLKVLVEKDGRMSVDTMGLDPTKHSVSPQEALMRIQKNSEVISSIAKEQVVNSLAQPTSSQTTPTLKASLVPQPKLAEEGPQAKPEPKLPETGLLATKVGTNYDYISSLEKYGNELKTTWPNTEKFDTARNAVDSLVNAAKRYGQDTTAGKNPLQHHNKVNDVRRVDIKEIHDPEAREQVAALLKVVDESMVSTNMQRILGQQKAAPPSPLLAIKDGSLNDANSGTPEGKVRGFDKMDELINSTRKEIIAKKPQGAAQGNSVLNAIQRDLEQIRFALEGGDSKEIKEAFGKLLDSQNGTLTKATVRNSELEQSGVLGKELLNNVNGIMNAVQEFAERGRKEPLKEQVKSANVPSMTPADSGSKSPGKQGKSSSTGTGTPGDRPKG